jgi:hypothetical protein
MSPGSNPKKALPVLSWLDANPQFVHAMDTLKELQQLQHQIDTALISWVKPGQVQAARLEQGQLELVCGSAALIAKLRQQEGTMLGKLQKTGLQVSRIRFRMQIQILSNPGPSKQAQKPRLSAIGQQAMRQLRGLTLPKSKA